MDYQNPTAPVLPEEAALRQYPEKWMLHLGEEVIMDAWSTGHSTVADGHTIENTGTVDDTSDGQRVGAEKEEQSHGYTRDTG